jgi:hypothetical protein
MQSPRKFRIVLYILALAVLVGSIALLITLLGTFSVSAKSAETYVFEWSEKVANGLRSGKYEEFGGVIVRKGFSLLGAKKQQIILDLASGLPRSFLGENDEQQKIRITGKAILSKMLNEKYFVVLDGGKAGVVVCKFSGDLPEIDGSNIEIIGKFSAVTEMTDEIAFRCNKQKPGIVVYLTALSEKT